MAKTVTIPAAFRAFTEQLHGEVGRAWLAMLPANLAACAQTWNLTLGEPFSNLTYHYVMAATRGDGLPVVLKACSPTGEYQQEATALRLADGAGMVAILAWDDARAIMLLERLAPGTTLRDHPDDAAATRIAAEVMRALWRPVPLAHPFPTVQQWRLGLDRLRARYDGGTGPIPADLVAQAEAISAELMATAAPAVVLHGDLHHDNILAAQRHPYLAIDPKGLIGEPAYEVGPWLYNPLNWLKTQPDPRASLERRVAIFAEMLQIDRARIRGWGIYTSVLSACWDLEDNTTLGIDTLAVARLLAETVG